jgi:hypothetical protein
MDKRDSLPVLPDLGGRLPGFGAAVDWFSMEQYREHWRGLAGCVLAGLLWPWLVGKLGGLIGLGLVDGLLLGLVGVLFALLGVGRWVMVQRQALARERLRLRRAALEDRLFEQGYSTLFSAYERAVVGCYDPRDKEPLLVNFAQYKGELHAISGHVDELVSSFRDELAALRAARPAVTVCPAVDAPCLDEPSILPLLEWPTVEYVGTVAEVFVDRLVKGQGYGLRALTAGPSPACSEEEYRVIVDLFVGAGVLVRDSERRTCVPAPSLVTLRGQWALAGDDLPRRLALEDAAHAWVMECLAGSDNSSLR